MENSHMQNFHFSALLNISNRSTTLISYNLEKSDSTRVDDAPQVSSQIVLRSRVQPAEWSVDDFL